MIEFLEIFLFGQGDVQMAEPLSAMAVGSIITGGVQLLSGIFGGGAAKRREKAARREKARLNRKLNYLAAQTAPSYSSSGRIRTPYMKLTMGDYFNKLPGVLTNLSVGWQKDYVREIALDKFQKGTATDEETGETSPTLIENTNAKDKHMLVLPHILDVTINFRPIHNFTPKNSLDSPFIGIDKWVVGKTPSTSVAEIKEQNGARDTDGDGVPDSIDPDSQLIDITSNLSRGNFVEL